MRNTQTIGPHSSSLLSETGHESCPEIYYIKHQGGGGFDWLGKDGRHAIKQSYFKDREPWLCQGFRARLRSD